MKTKTILFGCAVAIAGAASYVALKFTKSDANLSSPPLATSAAEKPAMKGGSRCHFPPGWSATYDYSGSVRSQINIQGMSQPVDATQEYTAKLAFELLQSPSANEWVLLGQFSSLNETLTKAHGESFEEPFLVKVGASCDLRGFARRSSVSKKVGQVQQVAMHDLFIQFPESTSGVTKFENGTGLAKAEFAKDAHGSLITRTIKSYEMAWRVKSTFQVTQSFARAFLDQNWIESFQGQEGISGGLVSSAVANLELKKEANSSVKVATSASRKVTDYQWENLLQGIYTDVPSNSDLAAVSAAERPYVESMKGSTLESAFDSLLKHVDEKTNIEEQWHEMAGYLNGHPEKIEEFAEGLTQPDFPEQAKAVSFLVLNKTNHPQAKAALTALRNNAQLTVGDRTRASLALVTRKDVGMDLAKELRRDALQSSSGDGENDFVARSSLLHLGVLAGTHKDNAEVASFARETVRAQIIGAGDDTYLLSPALGAAGNLGDPALLSTLVGYTTHPDYRVRALVPKSLRGYAYAQTEDIFVDWLARESHPDVKEEIFDILYHQLATAQRNAGPGVVREAIRHLKMGPMVAARQSIVHLIGRVKNQYPEAKVALIEQVPEEFRNRSGIFDQIANYLAPQEVELALSRMPEFAHQYGPADQQRLERAVVELGRTTPPEHPTEMP